MKCKIILYFLVLVGVTSCSRNTRPVITPTPAPSPVTHDIALQHTYYKTGDSLQFFLLFEDKRNVLEVQKSATQLTYEVKAGKNDQDASLLRDTVKLVTSRIVDAEGGLYINLKLPAAIVQVPNVIYLQLWQQLGNEIRMGSLFQIPLQKEMLEKQHVLVYADSDQPVIRNYVTTSAKLKMKSAADSSAVTVPYIVEDFAPALPPMSTKSSQQNRTLPVADSLIINPGEPLQFEKEGLYILWANQPFAQGLLVQPWAYPEITMARELVEPLIYLTTSLEREKLNSASDPKKAADAFWLQVAGRNTGIARALIKEFYNRVETANKLYASHEAGWASDRGMIHIVLGKPDEVTRVSSNEVWTYRQNRTRPYIKFVFTKKQNTFTQNHYELVRLRDYQEVWYSAVAKWRAGITEI